MERHFILRNFYNSDIHAKITKYTIRSVCYENLVVGPFHQVPNSQLKIPSFVHNHLAYFSMQSTLLQSFSKSLVHCKPKLLNAIHMNSYHNSSEILFFLFILPCDSSPFPNERCPVLFM